MPDSLRLDGSDSLALAFMASVGRDSSTVDSLAIDSAAALDAAEALRNDNAVAVDSAVAPPADTATATADTGGAPPVAPAPAAAGPAYVIDGATVQSVAQYSDQGRSGWRSIQALDTGQRIIVETSLVNSNDPNALAQGGVTVVTSAGQSVGTTRILDLLITVRGPVDEATMRQLLPLLVERAQ